ncbi:MAG: hypothetical protein HYX46_00285 [Betaproteobacteria bacterium]|nr:hypothetical protein [Betaproteobacteria bacterium]
MSTTTTRLRNQSAFQNPALMNFIIWLSPLSRPQAQASDARREKFYANA